jgi:hypothetical protein
MQRKSSVKAISVLQQTTMMYTYALHLLFGRMVFHDDWTANHPDLMHAAGGAKQQHALKATQGMLFVTGPYTDRSFHTCGWHPTHVHMHELDFCLQHSEAGRTPCPLVTAPQA